MLSNCTSVAMMLVRTDFCRSTPIVDDEIFSTVPGLNLNMFMISTLYEIMGKLSANSLE